MTVSIKSFKSQAAAIAEAKRLHPLAASQSRIATEYEYNDDDVKEYSYSIIRATKEEFAHSAMSTSEAGKARQAKMVADAKAAAAAYYANLK